MYDFLFYKVKVINKISKSLYVLELKRFVHY